MYTTSDLRKGVKIEISGVPYLIIDFSFIEPGRRQAIYTCKLRNMINGSTMTKSFRSDEKIEKPRLEEKELVYSYKQGDEYVFMDDDYHQVPIKPDVLGDMEKFLQEDMSVTVLYHNDSPIEVTIPNFVEKKVISAEPGAKGNTATKVTKPVVLEGGYTLQVPIFIQEGDVIKVDTRTGEYSDRVSRG